jgi:hypothetical protein
MAPKRKGLGKQNFEWVKGWITQGLPGWPIKIYCHSKFSLAQSNIENYKTHCQQSYVNTICKSITILINFSGGKWCLQRKYMCRQHETLDCTKLYNQTCVTSEWYPFVKFLAGVGIHFLLDIWGWVKLVWLFNGWISKIFTKKPFLFGATPRHK